jgi:hypothetical protein
VQVVDCPACDSAGVVTCSRCDGTGGLLEEKVFNFSRRGRLCQSSDDLEGLPRRIIRSRSEQVFVDTVDIHDPRWHAVPPLHELFEEAASLEQDDTKIAAAELTIRATPITEVDYALQSKPRTLAIIGFDQSVRGDLSLWDVERIVFVTVIAVLLVLLVLLYSTRAGV